MASLTTVNMFWEDMAHARHNFGSDTFRWALTNTAPTVAATGLASITEIAAGFGYSAGGNTVTISSASQTGGVLTIVTADTTFTAAGGSIGPFRYALLYNDTSAGNLAVGFFDYGVAYTILDTKSFVIEAATILQGPV